MTDTVTTRPRVSTAAGELAISVNPALSEYDVEVIHDRATLRDAKPYTRYAIATLPAHDEEGGRRHVDEPITINGVTYDVTITAHQVDGVWTLPDRYEDGKYPRINRPHFGGEATAAARRYLDERVVPVVLDWLNTHPAECDAMEHARLMEVYRAMTERITRAEAAVQTLRDYRERVDDRLLEVTR